MRLEENTPMTVNKQIRLAARPKGAPKPSDFAAHEAALPEPGAGDVLVKTLYLSLDPYMRGRISEAKSYAPPLAIGDVMIGGAVGQVVRSNHGKFKPGDIVEGMLGWQEYAVARAGALRRISLNNHPLSYALGVLGMPGMTAYFGLLEVGKPKPGDTVVVSAASGGVGMLVGQIAKIAGCRVVGTAGTDEKCAYVLDELGFDAAINYRASDNLAAELAAACPNGVDVYFDNVGGPVTDTVIAQLAMRARVVVCGVIHQYNMTEDYLGSSPWRHLLIKRARVEGFLIFDWLERYAEGLARMGAWLETGRVKYREDVTDGLDNAPVALIGLLEGRNFGKAVVKVAEKDAAR